MRKLAFNNGTKPEDPIANETIFVSDGDIILRIKFFTSSAELQRIVFKDSEKRDFFSIDYLGPVRNDKEWLLENEKGWEMKKLVFYVLPTNSFTQKYARANRNFKVRVSVRSVDRAGFLDVFYEIESDFPEWESTLKAQAREFELIHKSESGLKVFRAVVPEQGILIDPYKFSDVDLPFNYSIEVSGEKSKVTMIFEKSSLDSFFRSIGKIKEQEFQESQLEIRCCVQPYHHAIKLLRCRAVVGVGIIHYVIACSIYVSLVGLGIDGCVDCRGRAQRNCHENGNHHQGGY